MRKIFIVSVIGIGSGIFYWLRKKQSDGTMSETLDKIDLKFESKLKQNPQYINMGEELAQSKSEIVQTMVERHSEAGEIMKGAYYGVMENFVDDFSDEKNKNEANVIDQESVPVIEEIEFISNELDELLKK